MDVKYRVYSRQGEAAMLELTRTDRRVAEHDAELIKSILSRPAWVEEVET